LIVLKLSGKLFEYSNVVYLKDIIEVIRNYNNKIRAIIVGGGNTAREYIKLGREFGLTESKLDILGIKVTRLNAFLVSQFLNDLANHQIPSSIEEAMSLSQKIIVMGGTEPASSTYTVALLLADSLGIKEVVSLSDVEGIYTGDPKKRNDARLLSRISTDELREFLNKSLSAGSYELVDYSALDILDRSKMKIYIMSFKDKKNLINFLEGRNFIGTEIYSKGRS